MAESRPPKSRLPRDDEGDSENEEDVAGDFGLDSVFPGEEISEPLTVGVSKDRTDYRRMIQGKGVCQHMARILTGLSEFARREFPEDYAILTSRHGPMLPSFLRDPLSSDALKTWVFSEILRLQGSLDYSKEGEIGTILTYFCSRTTTKHYTILFILQKKIFFFFGTFCWPTRVCGFIFPFT
jgi:hypothetical protein